MELLNQHQLLQKISQESRWSGKDQFPSNNLWGDEAEKWLGYIKSKGHFEKLLPRLRDLPAQRDEALAEIKAAYFIETYVGYTVRKWDPRGKHGKVGDFTFTFAAEEIFCEVKSPGWERAIVESLGATSSRLKQPKYLPGIEVSSFSNVSHVRSAISKAYPKFVVERPNLLILVDDLKVPLTYDTLGVKIALYDGVDGCFSSKRFENLGAVAILNVENTGTIEYRFCVYHNSTALKSAVIPRKAFAKYKQFFKG
jgi:hypothetical protein